MATISKSKRPRKSPGLTRNGKIRLRTQSITQLEAMLEKSQDRKSRGKILQELIRQRAKNNKKPTNRQLKRFGL